MANPKLFRQAAEDVHDEKKQEDNAPEEKPDAPATAPKGGGGDNKTESKEDAAKQVKDEGDNGDNKQESDNKGDNNTSNSENKSSDPVPSTHEKLRAEYVDKHNKEKASAADDAKDAKDAVQEQKDENGGGENAGESGQGNAGAAGGENANVAGGEIANAAGGENAGGNNASDTSDAANAAAEAGKSSKAKEFVNSDKMGYLLTGADALTDLHGLATASKSAADDAREDKKIAALPEKERKAAEEARDARKAEEEKQIDAGAIVTNSINTVTGGINTYRDIVSFKEDEGKGKVGERYTNTASTIADGLGAASSATGVVGELFKNRDKNKVAGKVGDIAGGTGNFINMTGQSDKVRRQNSSISSMKKISEKGGDGAPKSDRQRKKAADQYIDFTRAGRYESGFGTAASVLDTISSGLSIAGDFMGKDNPLSAVMEILGPILSLISKGLNLIGGFTANKSADTRREKTVNAYFEHKKQKIMEETTHPEADKELLEQHPDYIDNIIIARMGLPMDNIASDSQKSSRQKEIFNAICKRRAAVIQVNPDMMKDIGVDPNNQNKEEAILEALGYEE